MDLINGYRKRRRAYGYGVTFLTSRSFVLPSCIRLQGTRYPLLLPDETGIRVAMMEVLFDDCYKLERVAQQIKTVLDIGANVGVFCMAARQIFPECQIYAYEPNPALEKYLKVQARSADAEYEMVAISRHSGLVTLNVSADSVCTTSTVDPQGTVQSLALSDAMGRAGGSIDFVKMDCEGAEWELLEDVPAWANVRNLAMEYHATPDHLPDQFHHDARDALKRLGFNIHHQIESSSFGIACARRS